MFDFPLHEAYSDLLDVRFYLAVERFIPVTADPRPFERLVAFAGPFTTVRETLDNNWRAEAAETLHPRCKPATIKRNLHVPLNALANFILGQRREKGCDTRRTFFLTPEQADDLLEVAGTPERYGVPDPQKRIRTLIALLLGTGCRPGESFVIDADDINWTTRECKIRGDTPGAGKTEASERITYLPAKAADLMEYLPESGPIILNRKGRPFTIRDHGGGQIRKEFDKLRIAADLPKECTPYSLRHTMATWTYASTKDVKLLMSRGGWAKHDTAFRYAKLAPSDLAHRLKKHGWDFGNDLDN